MACRDLVSIYTVVLSIFESAYHDRNRQRTPPAASERPASSAVTRARPLQHHPVRDQVQRQDEPADRELGLPGQSLRVEDGEDVVGDEVAGVLAEPRAPPQRVL